ncbi:SRPBCC family protein [Flavobacterium sp.]|uniref:SRPBCC family protein n=1 Tax=Flavobacterium sp. TaxID=239 RepID=UPI002B4B2D0D|nr:SRPBCC family protein [Flavobacterium sp.]HLP63041.1 SRPBCC family protein [Flavobacterium sp.]
MITVQTTVHASLEKAWEFWTQPEHVKQWNNASDDWHCPKATNDLRVGGKFNYTMASKDGTMSFDFEGEYSKVEAFSLIEYHIIDGRKVVIQFEKTENGVQITESFDPENVHSEELQRDGWQAILDNFKKHCESN